MPKLPNPPPKTPKPKFNPPGQGKPVDAVAIRYCMHGQYTAMSPCPYCNPLLKR